MGDVGWVSSSLLLSKNDFNQIGIAICDGRGLFLSAGKVRVARCACFCCFNVLSWWMVLGCCVSGAPESLPVACTPVKGLAKSIDSSEFTEQGMSISSSTRYRLCLARICVCYASIVSCLVFHALFVALFCRDPHLAFLCPYDLVTGSLVRSFTRVRLSYLVHSIRSQLRSA